MISAFFETLNNAAPDFPYVSYTSYDLNCLPHIHEEIELAVLLSGSTDVTCESCTYTMCAGDICVFMPGEIHSFTSHGKSRLYVAKLHCKNSHEQINFPALRARENIIKNGTSLNKKLRTEIETLVSEVRNKAHGYGYAANGISQQIIVFLIRSGILKSVNTAERKKLLFYVNLLQNVNKYIELHYSEPISLADISSYCNLSEYYFAHMFKKATGRTFYNHLTIYRLEKALPLLLYSDKKIIEIASLCGFSNTRSFNRLFKKFIFKTPREYIAEANATADAGSR